MKKLVILLLLTGCIGSATPHNPLDRETKKAWWQADTATITSNNPWEVYVQPNKEENWDDPWSTHESEPLFPKDFKGKVDEQIVRPTIKGKEI